VGDETTEFKVQLHAFLTSALDAGECSASRPSRFTPGTRQIGWVEPRSYTDAVAKRKNPIIARAENRSPVVQPVA